MLHDMEIWTAVRRALFVEQISKREASRRFGLTYYMVDKISASECPGRYQRASPPVTKLTPFLPFIEGYLEDDKSLPLKQRPTKKRIYDRLCVEHHFPYSYRAVSDYLLKKERFAKTEFVILMVKRSLILVFPVRCLVALNNKLLTRRSKTMGELFAEEQSSLLPLPVL